MTVEKLAPPLAAAYERYVQEGRRRAPLRRPAGMMGLVSVEQRGKPVRVVVSVECDPDAPPVGTGDTEINEGGRSIRTGIVPLDALEELAAQPGVRRIVPAAQLRPCLDQALVKVGVPEFRTRLDRTGDGVLVGVVDTGIFLGHPEFSGRVERIWDQTIVGGNGVPEGRYGAEFTDLAAGAEVLSRDVEGHGTHVAGIAAGTEGVAPEARIVAVKTDFQDAHIIDGIQYVFRLADELDMPAVVNLSLGGHSDPHDGTDVMSLAIEEESGPGRIVCCAAGNEGEDDIHARLAVTEGATLSVPCHPGRIDGSPDLFWLNGWYSGGDRLEVAVASPSGDSTDFQAVLTAGSPVRAYELADGVVQIVTPGPDPANGDHNFFVAVEPTSPAPAAGAPRWRLVLRGANVSGQSCRADVWILGRQEAQPPPQFSGPAVHDALKIGSPGAATSAITVAASTTRTQWRDIDGTQRLATWLVADDIAGFSSEGPRRDGMPKPDVTAPGAMVVSALSRDAVGLRRAFMIDDRHLALQGTSMACPFVAGLTALLLEGDPSADPDKIRSFLTAAAAVPGGAPGSFDPKWGHGLVDASRL
ncbi:S8 family serine peptidase [Streptomyces sp. NBC_00094]|uniref:S8 family serine peptidase n=1 Tax=Streptomyces sp. NBC_00094 TaxID=2903620 RepID=UPI00225BC9DA|nr:S8 family serine peptidase [Streptomyces sp. NBC_00094]MCX5395053.1 S8 family serine peptidase [Streptomyces sp. NBC_00094]